MTIIQKTVQEIEGGTILRPAGVCYRALRRLPGQDLHLPEKRVFQEAACLRVSIEPPAVKDAVGLTITKKFALEPGRASI